MRCKFYDLGWYLAWLRAYVPKADKRIVFDRFHVMRQVLEAADKVRKTGHRQLAEAGELDYHICLSESISDSRLSILTRLSLFAMPTGIPFRFLNTMFNPRSNISRALVGAMFPHDKKRIYARNFEAPSGGCVGTACAIARPYSDFVTGGKELGLRSDTLQALAAPAILPTRGFYDECMRGDSVMFSLCLMKRCPLWFFGNEGSFEAPGAGRSLGFADPITGIGYGYVTNRMGASITGAPREVALRNALYSSNSGQSGTQPRSSDSSNS